MSTTIDKKSIVKNYRFLGIMLIAMIAGCIVGWFWKDASVLKPLGTVFINMMFCIVVPLVFSSIAGAVANMKSRRRAGRIMGVTVATFVITGAIAAVIMFVLMKLFPPVLTAWKEIPSEDLGEYATLSELLVNFFTASDFVGLLSRKAMLPLIVFSLLCAILLNGKFFGRSVARAIFFIPVILSTGLMETIDEQNILQAAMEDTEGIADGTGTNNIVKGFTKDNIKPLFYQPDMDLHISCDFNYDPMCWVFFHKTQDKIYVFDELVEEHTSTLLCAKKVIEKFPKHKGNIIINGDAAGRQHNCMQSNPDMTNFKILQRELENYYRKEVELEIHKANPHKIKRFEAFNNLVKRYDGKICFYISDVCKWTLYNIENAKFKEGTNEVDEPTASAIAKNPELKFMIHPLDAVTYPAEYYFPIK